MNKTMLMCAAALAAACAWSEPAAPGAGRDAFLRNQAYAEMQRVSGQVDVLQSNLETLERRVAGMEGGSGEIGGVKRDIEALRADIASVRREMASMRAEITEDLTKKIQTIMKSVRSAPAPQPVAQPQPTPPPRNCKSYRVQPGDTLSLISQAFKTTVREIREMNHLKNDNLRVGQELLVPAPRR